MRSMLAGVAETGSETAQRLEGFASVRRLCNQSAPQAHLFFSIFSFISKKSPAHAGDFCVLVFVYSAFDIRRVEYFVCLVTAGLLKEFLIELEHCGVILRFAVGEEVLIGIVKNGSTNGLEVDFGFCLCALNGLTAAVYTAAGTAHNLDKVNFGFAALDLY